LIIFDNEATKGGGIHIESVIDAPISPKLENIMIRNNSAGYDGGGLFCDWRASPLIRHVRILNNLASRNGGGIFCTYNGSPQIVKCDIIGNIAQGNGGGIHFDEAYSSEQIAVDSSKINKNMASSGAGIFCTYFAHPIIKNTEINENTGDGIFSWEYTALRIYNSEIIRNSGHGATCSGDGSGFRFVNVLIAENGGSGINLGYYGGTSLSGTTIKKNKGYGIYLGVNSHASFDPNNRCNIYHNRSRDLYAYQSEINQPNHVDVIVDTFTVLIPTEQQASPLSAFSFNILHEAGPIPIEYKHYYVSPDGINSNSGLSPDQARKTISYQLAAIPENNDENIKIHLASGIYSPSTNGESFPLYGRPKVWITGTSKDSVIIDAEHTNRVIHVYKPNFSLSNLTIRGGKTSEGGGGIYYSPDFSLSTLYLEDVIITENSGNQGGGIFSARNIILKAVDIFHNEGNQGGGIFLLPNINATFDSVSRCNIFLNKGNGQGNDLYAWGRSKTGIFKVYLDKFTTKNPDDEQVYPRSYFNLDIKYSVNDSVYFVDPVGSDSNPGLTPDQPLKTITYALSLIPAENEKNFQIFLANGRYSPLTNGEKFPIYPKSLVTIRGESKKKVIIDAQNSANVFSIEADNIYLSNMTLTGGNSNSMGGGLYFTGENLNLTNVVIVDNNSYIGGGIYCDGLINFKSTSIYRNTATLCGGIFFDEQGSAIFDQNERCNIYNNVSNDLGIDLFASGVRPSETITVYLDTFTVSMPEEKYIYPLSVFRLYITGGYSAVLVTERATLYPNFPNPFKISTTIRFAQQSSGQITLQIYNVQGKVVKTLLKQKFFTPDEYSVIWDGENNRSQKVASGVYYYRMEAGEFQDVKKMILLK